MIIVGEKFEEGREVTGKHLSGGQNIINASTAAISVDQPGLNIEITYADPDDFTIDVDMTGLGPSIPPGAMSEREERDTMPSVGVPSLRPDDEDPASQLVRSVESVSQRRQRRTRRRGPSFQGTTAALAPPRVPTFGPAPAVQQEPEELTEDDIEASFSIRPARRLNPPPKPGMLRRKESPPPSLGKTKFVPQKRRKMQPPKRHSLRPGPRPAKQDEVAPKRNPGPIRGASMGQRVARKHQAEQAPISLGTIDRGWDEE
jgi:hypothetical protein